MHLSTHPGTSHSVQMAPWSHIITSNPRFDQLRIYTLSILTLAALTEGPAHTNSTSPTDHRGHDPISALEHFQRSLCSIFNHVSHFTRQSYLRATAGEIGLWDMVHLFAACGLVQAVQIWRRRRGPRQESFAPSNSSIIGDSQRRGSTRASLDDTGNPKTGQY